MRLIDINLKILILIGTLILAGISFPVQAEKVNPEITLISVYDNYQVDPKLKTAWGFATIIKTPQELILFDTGGNSEILLSNMEKLSINPASIKKVVISHIHGDHVGGLEDFLERNSNVTVFIPSSFPKSVKNMIIQKGANFVEVSAPGKISDFAYTTGELYGPPKEQSLIINSKKGLVVITCLLYTSPSPRDAHESRMPSSA